MRRKYDDPDYCEELREKRRKRYNSDEQHRAKILDAQRHNYSQDPDKKKMMTKRYAKENPDKVKTQRLKYYAENRDSIIEYQKLYAAENPEKISAWSSVTRARRKERFIDLPDVMDELNQLCMEEAYHAASERSEMFGFDWHVDHMIPLQANEASGLHIYSNIQVIPATLNQFKHKKMLYTNDLEWLVDAIE